jgi:transposase-like protein
LSAGRHDLGGKPPARSSITPKDDSSKSSVSLRFVALSTERLTQWLSRRIEVDLPVVMIDGIHVQSRVVLVGLGFDARGKKHVLGLWEGSTEKTQVVRSLFSDLIERSLDADVSRLRVIDGAKALRRDPRGLRGERRHEHKRRQVLEHLPEELHASVGRAMKDTWQSKDPVLA